MGFRSFLLWVFRVANYDFCPKLNSLTNWLKQPLGWGVCAIVFSLLVGMFVGPQGYVLASAFLALLVLGLAWPWLSMKGIRCQLELPDRWVEENQELEFVFHVKNYWPLPVFGLMVEGDFLQDSDEHKSVAFSLKRVGAWSESKFRIRVTPRRRGKLPTGNVTVASGFPFGLVDIPKTVDTIRPAIVWPSRVPLDGFPVSDSTRFCLHGALRDKAGNDGDSIGVRAYRSGDRLKNIHWAQSARSQKLMVRERQSISSTGATVLLDLSPGDHEGQGVNDSFEWTIRIAASICQHLHETHSPVRVVIFGLPEQAQTCEDNRNGLHRIMDFLANLPTLAEVLIVGDALKKSEYSESRQRGAFNSYANASNGLLDGHLFVIGTNQSKRIHSVDSHNLNVTPIVVGVDGFKTEDDIQSFNGNTASLIGSDGQASDRKTILIESPLSAAEELVSQWNRSF